MLILYIFLHIRGGEGVPALRTGDEVLCSHIVYDRDFSCFVKILSLIYKIIGHIWSLDLSESALFPESLSTMLYLSSDDLMDFFFFFCSREYVREDFLSYTTPSKLCWMSDHIFYHESVVILSLDIETERHKWLYFVPGISKKIEYRI